MPEVKSGKASWIGTDKERRPCLLILPKLHHPKETTPEAMIRFGVYTLEQGARRCDLGKADGGSSQIGVVYDRRGMTRKNFDSKLFKVAMDLVDIAQDFYAERLGRVYVLGANWFYFMLWGMVKPFLADKTRDKFILLDDVQELLQYFEPESLYDGWDDEEL